MVNSTISTLANQLTGIESLRNLFCALNFDYADDPVVKDRWSNSELDACKTAKVVAEKNGYKIVYVELATDRLSIWKSIAAKIIEAHNRMCIVCSHHPGKFKWIVSVLSIQFSRQFKESQHVPVVIHPNAPVSRPFVKFLTKLRVSPNTTPIDFATQASEAYNLLGMEIQGQLIENVFEALKILSRGIVSDPKNCLELNNSALHDIRESVFILIYRIMFVLYAEDRDIFQPKEIYYEEYSMQWIKDKIFLKNQTLVEYDIDRRLKALFRLIEKGSEAIGHPKNKFYMRSYYGRLFDYNAHLPLEQLTIKNEYLLAAISLLTRTKDKNSVSFLDYAGLETRHLGAIYEDLMERYLSVENGEIVEQSSSKERKASGSYYTPPNIVEYIVQSTIGPLVAEIVKTHPKPADQIDRILELNVLDPAMGSGHFLVGAVNYLAREIAKIEHGDHVSDKVLVERKRDVARRCIYGVDKNPLAVDIAQVSLWLETLSSDKPLSFLDAHIKSGNSLFGSMLDNLFETQTTLSESVNAQTKFKETIRLFVMLETLDDDTLESVLIKTAKYNDIRAKGTMYSNLKFLLDAKTASHLDSSLPAIRRFFDKVADPEFNIEREFGSTLPTEYAQKHGFFHWDLQFPEVFYSPAGTQKTNPGFDAIIGNPPYLNLPKNDALKNHKKYTAVSKGIRNIASYFIRQGCDLIRDHGYLGYIVPKSFLTVESWRPIRSFVLAHELVIAHDVGKQWSNVALEQAIIVMRKNARPSTVSILCHFNEIDKVSQSQFTKRGSILTHVTNNAIDLLQRIEEATTPLAQIATMPRGITIKSSMYTQIRKPNFVRVLGGINVGRYFIKDGRANKPNRFLLRNHSEVVTRKNIFKPRRIIYQNIGSMITATMVEDIPTDDTVNNLLLKTNKYSYDGILALLNSELMDFYLKFAVINNSKLTIHLDHPYLGKLPIAKPTQKIIQSSIALLSNFDNLTKEFAIFLHTLNPDQQTALENAKLTDISSLLSSNSVETHSADIYQLFDINSFSKALQTFRSKIAKLELQLNNDIYRLYKLSRSDVELIQSLRESTKDVNRLYRF